MVNKENWEKLKRNQPPMYQDLKKRIQKELSFLKSSNDIDETSMIEFHKNHIILKNNDILYGFDTLLQDYETLLSM